MSNINKLTTRKLAAQLVIPRLSIDRYTKEPEYKQQIHHLVNEGVGGFCIFQGSPQQVRIIIDDLQILSDIPLIFCADFEHGLTMRLDNGTEFPKAMALGKAGNLKTIKQVASIIAKEAKMVGIHWNLAPVCDINSNMNNPIINIRSFGESEDVVSNSANAYIEGTQREKVLSCAKHFPGHGDTDVDSHIGVPILNKTYDSFKNLELIPFEAAIRIGVKSIMVGHLAVPSIDDTGKPASISKPIIDILNNELNFKGIVLTDALDMKAITEHFNSGEAALEAFIAGNDIIFMPENPTQALNALESEINNNETYYQQALLSAKKLYKEKQWCGLTLPIIDIDQKDLEHYAMQHQKIALEAAEPALKFEGRQDLVPLTPDKVIAGFTFVFGEEMDKGILFFKMLAQAIDNDVHFGFLNDTITDEELLKFIEEIKFADLVIFCFFAKGKAYQKRIEISGKIKEIMSKFSKAKETITILFGNPYLSKNIDTKNIIYTYSDSLPSIAAAVMKLSGRKANVN